MRIGRRPGWSLLLVALGAAGTVGCSDGDTSAESASPGATASQAQRTSAAAVAVGMRTLGRLANGIAASAGADNARAENLASQLEPAWRPIEGTVKQNNPDAYLAMEESVTVLERAAQNGDGTAARNGARSVTTTVQEYLARYPG